jgi:hypothetical protein
MTPSTSPEPEGPGLVWRETARNPLVRLLGEPAPRHGHA